MAIVSCDTIAYGVPGSGASRIAYTRAAKMRTLASCDSRPGGLRRAWEWHEDLAVLHRRFTAAQPYPHVVVEDVFPPNALGDVYRALPPPSSTLWTQWGSGEPHDGCPVHNRKRGISSLVLLPDRVAEFLRVLNSDAFVDDIRAITGRGDLTPDFTFNGGGVHQTGRGARLRVHADKVRHPRPARYDQAVNLVAFISPYWQVDYGGPLELWPRDGEGPTVSIPAVFNRLVLFASDRTTYHGHPQPLRCPEGEYRTSLAVYYYAPRVSPSDSQDNDILWM